MWTSLLGGTIHRATELRLCTGVLSQELGGSGRMPRGAALVGEAWLMVGGQSGAGGLGGQSLGLAASVHGNPVGSC